MRLPCPPSARLWTLLVLGGCAAHGTACSFLFPADALQCSTDDDCLRRGADFAGTSCRESMCVAPDDGVGGGGGGDSVECTTNGECIDANYGNPWICRAGRCVDLTLPGECPIVIGAGQSNEYLRAEAPILIGAYSYVDPTAPRQSVPTLNYELALDELNEKTRGGLPGGPNGSLRPFVAIVCKGTNSPNLEASAAHLVDRVGVPAILASLFTKDLLSTFLAHGLEQDVFFLSPLESDSSLTLAEDGGLLWHMLAAALDLAPAYVPLLDATERHLRDGGNPADGEDLRVALVEADTPFLADLGEHFVENARWNGRSALDNEADGAFLRVRTDSDIETSNVDLSSATSELLDFAPHVVVSLGSGESVLLMSELEAGWPLGGSPRPFYLVSPYVFGRSDLASPGLQGLRSRLLGVNFAAAEDTSLYDLYVSRLESTYDVSFNLRGAENFYDATYFLMYAIAGAGNPAELRGREIALGMNRLLGGKTSFSVGPTDANDVVGYLRGSSNSTLTLEGTMGPPDFNRSSGARSGLPSVYCLTDQGAYVQNAMTYDAGNQSLVGTPPCITGWPP